MGDTVWTDSSQQKNNCPVTHGNERRGKRWKRTGMWWDEVCWTASIICHLRSHDVQSLISARFSTHLFPSQFDLWSSSTWHQSVQKIRKNDWAAFCTKLKKKHRKPNVFHAPYKISEEKQQRCSDFCSQYTTLMYSWVAAAITRPWMGFWFTSAAMLCGCDETYLFKCECILSSQDCRCCTRK